MSQKPYPIITFYLTCFPMPREAKANNFYLIVAFILLLQVVWCHRNLLTLLQANTAAGNGHAGSWTHLSPRLLRVPSLPLQILCRRQVFPSLPCGPVRGWLLWRHQHFPADALLCDFLKPLKFPWHFPCYGIRWIAGLIQFFFYHFVNFNQASISKQVSN